MKTSRSIYAVFFLLLISQFSIGQVGPGGGLSWDWVIQEGNSSFEAVGAIPDNKGNIYVTGFFFYVTTFGTNTMVPVTFNNTGNVDIIIAKYDTSGNFQWAKQAGGSGADTAWAGAVDASGNFYISGNFEGTATFGTKTLISSGNSDFFIAKYDPSGNCIWAQKAGGVARDGGNFITIDDSGNIYATGFFSDTATFGSFTLVSTGSEDIFIAKYNNSGTCTWAVSAGGIDVDEGKSIAVDGSGNAYITGSFRDQATFGSFNVTAMPVDGYSDYFIAKYNNSGTCLWVANGGTGGDDKGTSITIDANDNLYVTGTFEGTCSFGTYTLNSLGSEDVFIAKYNDTGTCLWATSGGGPNSEQSWSIAADPSSGNIYVTGSYDSTGTFGSMDFTADSYSEDIFFASYDSLGAFLWAITAGGESWDLGISNSVDSLGNVYLSGFFESTATFGSTNLTSVGNIDVFIAKLTYHTACTPPLVSITASGPTTFCEGESVVLFANFDSNYTYQWLFDDKEIPDETMSYIDINTAGDYSVNVTDNSTNCSNTSQQISVTVNSSNFSLAFIGLPRVFSSPPFNVAFDNMTSNLPNYNFYWEFGDDGTTTTTSPFYTYLYNGLFVVTLIAENKTTGCFDTLVKTDYVSCSGGSNDPCTINAQINYSGSSLICDGDSILLTATSGTGYSYQWIHNNTALLGATNSTFNAKEKGSYRVMISDTACSRFSLPFVLSHYSIAKPVIQPNGSIQPCSNDSMELYVNTLPFLSNYMWSTGTAGTSIWVNKSGDYTISAMDVSGCKVTSEPYKVNTAVLMPGICIVTVDSGASNNLIVWERWLSTSIDSYYIYKETTQAYVYSKIGAKGYNELSVFVDQNSNPAKKADRYKISLVDSCGVESALSEPHKTMHVTASEGTSGENNLIWSHYDGIPILTYYIYRGTTPNNLQLIDSIQSNLNSYTDLNPPSGVAFYRVTFVKADACEPLNFRGITSSGPYSQSLSNLQDYSQDASPYLMVGSKYEIIDSILGTNTTTSVFTSLSTWAASVDQSWITLVVNITKGNITATANTKNPGSNSRTATITLTGVGVDTVYIQIIQLGSSGQVGIATAGITNSLKIFPNPYKNKTQILYALPINSYVKAEVYNIVGRKVCELVNEFQVAGKYNYQFSAGSYGFTDGIYFLRFEVNGLAFTRKLIEIE